MVIRYIIHHHVLCGKYLNLWCVISVFLSDWLSVKRVGGGGVGYRRMKENLKQAPHPVWSPAMSVHRPEIVPWAEIKSWMLNCLSHSGIPCGIFLNHFCQQWASFSPVDLTVTGPWIFVRNRISWLSLLNNR